MPRTQPQDWSVHHRAISGAILGLISELHRDNRLPERFIEFTYSDWEWGAGTFIVDCLVRIVGKEGHRALRLSLQSRQSSALMAYEFPNVQLSVPELFGFHLGTLIERMRVHDQRRTHQEVDHG